MQNNGDALALALKAQPAKAIRTGIYSLDAITNGGPRAGHLVVIGGLTGQGKSALARQIALEVSIDEPTLYVSLEESDDDVRKSMGAKIARCSVDVLEKFGLDAITQHELNARRLRIHAPEGGMDMDQFETRMRKTHATVVILDHVRELRGWIPDGNAGGGHAAPSRIAQRLRAIAKETGKLLIVLQQLNEPKFGQRPTEYGLMDTKVLAQVAWLIVLVHWPAGNHRALNGMEGDWIVELLVRKNRYGRRGMLHQRFVGLTGSFWELRPEDIASVPCCAPRSKGTVPV